jgi:hypothetical protein
VNKATRPVDSVAVGEGWLVEALDRAAAGSADLAERLLWLRRDVVVTDDDKAYEADCSDKACEAIEVPLTEILLRSLVHTNGKLEEAERSAGKTYSGMWVCIHGNEPSPIDLGHRGKSIPGVLGMISEATYICRTIAVYLEMINNMFRFETGTSETGQIERN